MMTALSYCFVDRPMVALPVGVATEFASTNRMSDLVPGFSEAAGEQVWRLHSVLGASCFAG